MKHIAFLSVLLSALLGAYLYGAMLIVLKDAVPLEEVTIEIPKLPKYNFKWETCLKQFPNITEHGQAMKCYRTDI